MAHGTEYVEWSRKDKDDEAGCETGRQKNRQMNCQGRREQLGQLYPFINFHYCTPAY